jgi:hypothetical protein
VTYIPYSTILIPLKKRGIVPGLSVCLQVGEKCEMMRNS